MERVKAYYEYAICDQVDYILIKLATWCNVESRSDITKIPTLFDARPRCNVLIIYISPRRDGNDTLIRVFDKPPD